MAATKIALAKTNLLTTSSSDVRDDNDGIQTTTQGKLNLQEPVIQAALQVHARKDPNLIKELEEHNPDEKESLAEALAVEADDDLKQVFQVGSFKEAALQDGDGEPEVLANDVVSEKRRFKSLFRGALKKAAEKAVAAKVTAAQASADKSRIEDTSLENDTGKISMLLAVSQSMLNSNLNFLHLLNPDLQSLKYPPGPSGEGGLNSSEESIEADLLAPEISLDVDDFGAGAALYYMKFGDNGACKLRDGANLVEVSTKGWVFVFAVNIAMKDLDPKSEEFKQVKDKFGKPGDYRISRLFADMTTADIISPKLDLSFFGDYVFTPNTKISFQILIMRWLQMAQSTGSLLGYSITTPMPDSVNSLPPSFPPTDQAFQVYSYLEPGKTQPTDGRGAAGDKNMLLYLNMTKNKPFPEPGRLTYSGNWCINGIPATMAISGDIFFNDFLLPKLAVLNEASYIEAIKAKADIKGLKFEVGYTHGFRTRDDFGEWKRLDNGWSWSASNTKTAKDGESVHNLKATLQVSTTNLITVPPGGNEIVLQGTTSILEKSELKTIGISQNGSAHLVRKFRYVIELKSVLNGNLQLELPLPENAVSITTSRDATFLQSADLVNSLATSMRNSLIRNQRLKDAAELLRDSLESVGTFVVPGAGTLLLKDPVFNEERDLLMAAEYNGAD